MKDAGYGKKNRRLHMRIEILMVRGQYHAALELLAKRLLNFQH